MMLKETAVTGSRQAAEFAFFGKDCSPAISTCSFTKSFCTFHGGSSGCAGVDGGAQGGVAGLAVTGMAAM
jgi:hypothetical protein